MGNSGTTHNQWRLVNTERLVTPGRDPARRQRKTPPDSIKELLRHTVSVSCGCGWMRDGGGFHGDLEGMMGYDCSGPQPVLPPFSRLSQVFREERRKDAS
ncbi:hypothetical protein FQA47_001335 [Oryzias melastigma]|uniref:Uncharacterized protein n=1 Tax=Oryzias melastigma TaxID=30732 RepID=A0A834FIA6_ORYME|nr:hypothetical protein FQA47_001335 [Oryzias melastigma]